MSGLLYWLWGPGLLLIAAGVAMYAQHRSQRSQRHRNTPAE
jgi:hypothetical protein